MGVIATEHHNGKGIAGIAGLLNVVEVVNYKVTNSGDLYYDPNQVSSAVEKAFYDGCKIISMSFGSYDDDDRNTMLDTIETSVGKQILLIASAGNDNKDLDKIDYERNHYPSQFDNVLSVGAVDYNHKQLYFNDNYASNYGKDSIDVLAPGKDIFTTTYTNDKYSTFTDKSYTHDFGDTSAATPIVADVAALLWAYFPELTLEQIKWLLTTSGPESSDPDHFGETRLLNAVDLFTAAWDITHPQN
ncbi:MAG: S8 family serine peptidase [Candidatus Lokiarchaeota archaeon]|nr:S8 family serine peptidase [Candidatus Harpocratesius repetitus]